MSKTADYTESRFNFGRNWAHYLKLINRERIDAAETSLKTMLEKNTLCSQHFLDVGSGSGLFSLAARNLGAVVHSFDFDRESVGCTQELKNRYRAGDGDWRIERGDALDTLYLKSLGQFDVVYSWGVLHHTGDMYRAMSAVGPSVKIGGQLYIAIYNDQRWLSRYWARIKKVYNSGVLGKVVISALHIPYFVFRQIARILLTRSNLAQRGMDPWRDMFDWLGGYPFEVARPEEILTFLRAQGFVLDVMKTVDGRHGCNEFVFRRIEKGI